MEKLKPVIVFNYDIEFFACGNCDGQLICKKQTIIDTDTKQRWNWEIVISIEPTIEWRNPNDAKTCLKQWKSAKRI